MATGIYEELPLCNLW